MKNITALFSIVMLLSLAMTSFASTADYSDNSICIVAMDDYAPDCSFTADFEAPNTFTKAEVTTTVDVDAVTTAETLTDLATSAECTNTTAMIGSKRKPKSKKARKLKRKNGRSSNNSTFPGQRDRTPTKKCWG